MLPSNVLSLAVVGGLVLSGLGAASQKMTDSEITVKTFGRDFIAGVLIVIFLGFLIPDSFNGLGFALPVLALPAGLASLTGSNDLEIQVDPRL
jgi:hypothetical protein